MNDEILRVLDKAATAIETEARLLLKADGSDGGASVEQVERSLRRDLRGLGRNFIAELANDLQWDLMNSQVTNAKYMHRIATQGFRTATRNREIKGLMRQLIGDVPFVQEDMFTDFLFSSWQKGYLRGYNTGGGWTASKLLGHATDFNLRDRNVLSAIEQRAKLRSMFLGNQLGDATTNFLYDGMWNKGMGPRQMRAYLRARGFDDIAAWRMDRIARTEALISYEHGKYDTAARSGVEFIEWQTHIDDATRDTHVYMNGETVRLGDSFSNGLKHPGDSSGPVAEIINCRCTSAPVPSDRVTPEKVWHGDEEYFGDISF